MSKTKILVATQYPLDTGRPHGGVEAVSVNLVRGLSAFSDLEVSVVTLNKGIDQAKVEKVGNAYIHRLPKPDASELVTCVRFGKDALTKYIPDLKPDLIHSHDVYGIMAGHLPYPSVFTVHGFIHEDTRVSNKHFAYVRSLIWKYVETRGWRRQSNVISISPYVREKIKNYTSAVIHDIDNPVSEKFFQPRESLEDIVFFSAAVISPRKNTKFLVEAFERLLDKGVNAKLRLAGRIVDESYGDDVRELILSSKHKNSMQYLGEMSSEEIQAEMKKASVFVLVSLEENSPMGIEEAMAVGMPVITSNRCGMPYMIKHGQSGYLIDPFNINELVERMEALCTKNNLIESMSEESKKIAMERFHPREVSRKTRDVYLEILGSNRDRLSDNINVRGEL